MPYIPTNLLRTLYGNFTFAFVEYYAQKKIIKKLDLYVYEYMSARTYLTGKLVTILVHS